VLRIELAHEVRGMLQTVTSYAAATGGSIVNQSVFVYDAFSNLIADQQSHSGVVVPGTTPEVDYRYADGSANTVRRTSVTYPNGRVLNTVYGTTNSAADHLNQITSLNVTGDGGDLADYTYCGTNWQVQIAYPLPGIELTYIKQGSEPVGDGGDQYTGYDRFGRTIDIRWQTTSDGTSLERLLYGYDQDSRRIWRQQVLATGLDNAYTYDGLGQVVTNALGILDTSIGTITPVPAQTEAWNYDPTGNWDNYTTAAGGAVTLEQIRIYDQGNRLTQIESDPKPILVDRAGRMLEVPPDATGDWTQSLTLVWDAWSRIVQLSQNGSVLGYYTYDGLTRRMTRAVSGVTWHTYYSDIWRPLEERQDTQTTAAAQYLWGTRHRDDLVRRDRATTSGGLLNETRYVLMDYFSPAAITNQTGAVTERYTFSAFGVESILAPDFTYRSSSECMWNFTFQGQFQDSESQFLNYGYRYYSPYCGRWLSRDPLGDESFFRQYTAPLDDDAYAVADAESRKPGYLFAENNPISNFDVNGLVVVGIQGFGGSLSGANGDLASLVGAAGGQTFGRSQDGSIHQYIKTGYQNNPKEPVVLVGYSRGGVKITDVATWILKNIPCAPVYLVGIDPVPVLGGGPISVPNGVKAWTNYYEKNGGNTWGLIKVVIGNFNNINGTSYSGGNGNNINLTGYRWPSGALVNHGSMPAYVFQYMDALGTILKYKSQSGN
jgi:RHS repeat-associated protein